MPHAEDEVLRTRTLAGLSAFALPLTFAALETGTVEVEPDVIVWEGSSGTIHGHRVVLWLEDELCARVNAAPAVIDELTAAFAGAIAIAPRAALANLEVLPRAPSAHPRTSPYRGRSL